MRTPLSIALAIIVLSLGARHATAGSVYGDRCPPRLGTPQLTAIGCRLEVLRHSTDAATAELGRFHRSLSSESDNAGDRVFVAHGFCSFAPASVSRARRVRRTKSARQRLRGAKVLLDRYVSRLNSPAAQAIPVEVREPLVTEAVAIAAEAAALSDRLECPGDL